MKYSKLLLFSAILFLFSCATVYEAPGISSRISDDRKIAILPFDAVIQYKKLPKNTTVEQIKEMEQDMGVVFQEQMYTRFLKKAGNYSITFQDVGTTNALLQKNGIEFGELSQYTADELAEILDVDAVVSGKILTSKPMSTGGAIATGLLLGYSGATNKVDVNVSLYDGEDAMLLFKYDHTYSGGLGSSAEELSKAMMKHIEKKFPYRN
jgi:hypothetical protein